MFVPYLLSGASERVLLSASGALVTPAASLPQGATEGWVACFDWALAAPVKVTQQHVTGRLGVKLWEVAMRVRPVSRP